MIPTKYMSLDLEMNQPSGTIIQVGACIGDITTGQIVACYKFPIKVDEVISEFIEELTGVTNEIVQNHGVSLQEAYEKLKEAYEIHKPFRNCITWGGGDSTELRAQLGLDDEQFLFGRRWIDAKTLFIGWRMSQGESFKGGLAKSMTKMGLAFKGRKHDAMDDAINTFYIFMALLRKFRK